VDSQPLEKFPRMGFVGGLSTGTTKFFGEVDFFPEILGSIGKYRGEAYTRGKGVKNISRWRL